MATMSSWFPPNVGVLQEVITAADGELLLCSPYVSAPALTVVADALPNSVNRIEFWTKLDARDWLTGATDFEGLLDFINLVETNIDRIAVRHASHLHAKMIVSDGPKAIAGSANLTAGGFMRNIEVARMVTGSELGQLHQLVDELRPSLSLITKNELTEFVADCTARVESKEALLDLIRQEIPSSVPNQDPLMPYIEFLKYLERRQSSLAIEILEIATNADGNNNTGKVKQAFFGVQRFLQEYPHHLPLVENLPVDWFDVMDSDLSSDWLQFLDRFASEVNPSYEYSIPTLRGYLPRSQGGTLVGGGGGGNQLKRVWPFVARAVRASKDSQVGG